MRPSALARSEVGGAIRALKPSDIILASGEKVHIEVLLVEDDVADQAIVRRNLGRSRFFETEVTTCETLEQAEQVIRSVKFDLVIFDFWVGGVSTLPLIDLVRREYADLVPVVLSSVDVTDVHGLGMSFGALGYLHKADLSPSALDAVLRTALQQHAQAMERFDDVKALTANRQRAAERMAEAAHDAISSLNAIRGFAEAIAAPIANLDTTSYPDLIVKGSLRTVEILRRYLPSSAETLLTDELEFVLADVRGICREAIQSMRQTCGIRRQSVVFPDHGDALQAEVDPVAMYQVVFNLIENASKYSAPDSVIAVAVELDGDSISIGVEDQGEGMTAEEIQVARQLHGRIPSGLEFGASGSGIGLSIVQTVTDLHGGSLSITSEKGVGSRFVVVVPRWRTTAAVKDN